MNDKRVMKVARVCSKFCGVKEKKGIINKAKRWYYFIETYILCEGKLENLNYAKERFEQICNFRFAK